MALNTSNNKRIASLLKILGFCLIAAFFSAALTISVSAEDPENAAIVMVDTNRILENHPAFIRAQQVFQGEMQQMEEQLQEMGEEERIMAQQMMQQQLQQRGQELQAEALDEVRSDVAAIAEEKGYKYVVDSNALIVGGKDVTEEVLESLDLE